MIFKFAKLPIASESEAAREEKEKVFPTPENDPDRDLNWSKLFMLGNPCFCILESESGDFKTLEGYTEQRRSEMDELSYELSSRSAGS